MAVQSIPIGFNYPWTQFTIVLDAVRYTCTVRYNNRMDRWILDVADANAQPLLAGVPLLINRDLVAGYPTLALPPGTLTVFDSSGQGVQPGLASFLTDHLLLYLPVSA